MSGRGKAEALYPLLLQPQLHRRVWGGTWLEAFHGDEALTVHGPAGEPVGESWLADGGSVVLNGPLAGRTVSELAALFGPDLIGTEAHERYGPRMPLLAKLLDAATALSVQVHPDDAYALTEERGSGHLGKSEAWYVLYAEPGASVLWGFRQETTADAVRKAVASGTLPELMQQVPVRPGSVVVNPAGTVHAVGAGIRLYEIQQASDLTYRLYDHGRTGADGKPRELHLDKSLAVAELSGRPFTQQPATELAGGWTRLVQRPEFVLDRARLVDGSTVQGATDTKTLQLITLVSGAAELRPAAGSHTPWDALSLEAGSTVLLPAALTPSGWPPGANGEGPGYELTGHGELLRSSVPPPEAHAAHAPVATRVPSSEDRPDHGDAPAGPERSER